MAQTHEDSNPLRRYFTSTSTTYYVLGLIEVIKTEALRSTDASGSCLAFNLLKLTGYVMQQQFNIQQLCALPTLYLCVLYLSENKQRLVPLTA